MDLALEIYDSSRDFPEEEKFGLVSQMRRAAVSIPCNIAEGHARYSDKEFIHFLKIALGSNAELETQIILSHRLGFLSSEKHDLILKETKDISKMTISFINYLENKIKHPNNSKNNNNTKNNNHNKNNNNTNNK